MSEAENKDAFSFESTYSKIKSSFVTFKQRGKRSDELVTRAEKVLMFGAGWFGFKNSQELDSWCITQMLKAQKTLQPVFEMAFNPSNTPRLKIASLLSFVQPHRQPNPPPLRETDAPPRTRCALSPPSPPPNAPATHRSAAEEYDDDKWMAMLRAEEEQEEQEAEQQQQQQQRLQRAGPTSARSAASTVPFRSPFVTPDSAQPAPGSVALHSALLSSVHNLFTPQPTSSSLSPAHSTSSSRPPLSQPPLPFMDPFDAPPPSHTQRGGASDHVPPALIPELDYQLLTHRSQTSGLPSNIDPGGIYLL